MGNNESLKFFEEKIKEEMELTECEDHFLIDGKGVQAILFFEDKDEVIEGYYLTKPIIKILANKLIFEIVKYCDEYHQGMLDLAQRLEESD